MARSGGSSRAMPYALVYAISPSFTTAMDTLGAPRAVISCVAMESIRSRIAVGKDEAPCAAMLRTGEATSAHASDAIRRDINDMDTPRHVTPPKNDYRTGEPLAAWCAAYRAPVTAHRTAHRAPP